MRLELRSGRDRMPAMPTPPPFPVASRRGAALVLLLGLLAGCGRKGELYLPDEDKETAKQPAGTQPPGSDGTAPPPGPTETETLPDLEED